MHCFCCAIFVHGEVHVTYLTKETYFDFNYIYIA